MGSELLMMPSVAAVIRNKEDEILFTRKPEESLWGLPAGAIEPGERPGRTLRREVYEETGLMVHPTSILGVFGGGNIDTNITMETRWNIQSSYLSVLSSVER